MIKEYQETHWKGIISIENSDTFKDKSLIKGDFGIHIAKDGRVWVCIDGVAFLRFSPHRDGKMHKEVNKKEKSLLQSITDKDNKAIKEFDNKVDKGEQIRII